MKGCLDFPATKLARILKLATGIPIYFSHLAISYPPDRKRRMDTLSTRPKTVCLDP